MIKPIIGKKIVLFEVEPRDFEPLAELHRKDTKGYLMAMSLHRMTKEESENYVAMMVNMLRIQAFTVMTKEGKMSRRVGYVYITELTDYSCSVSGAMEMEFVKGLGRHIRKDKYTYTEDALRTLVGWCYESFPNMNRVETDVVESNRLSLKLVQKVGFKKEGVLREYLNMGEKRDNVITHSILRKEWVTDNVREEESTINKHTRV